MTYDGKTEVNEIYNNMYTYQGKLKNGACYICKCYTILHI